MKLKRFEICLIAVTLAFVCFTTGFFTGRKSSGGSITVEKYTAEPAASPAADDTPTSDAPVTSPVPAAPLTVHINTASADELKQLDGIGDVLAQRIIDYRTQNGPFAAPEDIMNVSGIGEKTYLNIKNNITVDERKG